MSNLQDEIPARVDTIGIAFPVDDFNRQGMDHTITAEGTPTEAHRYRRNLDGGGFLSAGISNSVWVEASLPKRRDPDDRRNDVACLLPEAEEILRDMYDEARTHVEVSKGHHFEESKVIRLDLVRDFHDVKGATPLLDGLADVVQPGRSKVRRFADPSRGQAETLRVGPKAWGCTLYDKYEESGRQEGTEDQLRFETRLHRDQLASVFARKNGGNVRVVGDLFTRGSVDALETGESALARAQRAWFDRVGFGMAIPDTRFMVDTFRALQEPRTVRDRFGNVVVVEGGKLLQVDDELVELTPAKIGALWSYLTLPGYRDAMHRNTARKYRALAEAAGLGPNFSVSPNDEGRAGSIVLDYDAGTLLHVA